MSCDFPLVCRWWDAKLKAVIGSGCTAPQSLFEKCMNPCEMHQLNCDYAELEELWKENDRLRAELRY